MGQAMMDPSFQSLVEVSNMVDSVQVVHLNIDLFGLFDSGNGMHWVIN